MLLLLVSVCFIGCVDTIPHRATITPDEFLSSGPTSCPDDQDLVSEQDGDKTIRSCVPKTVEKRPDGAITFKSDYCGCNNGKAVTFGNCSTFCADKNTSGASILYASFTVSEAISLNEKLGNVFNWCNVQLESDNGNPKCLLNVKDESGSSADLEVTLVANSNSIKVDITNLAEDKTYLLTFFEQISKAKSNTVQIIKDSEQVNVDLLGTLKVAPISQFTCIIRNYEKEEMTNGTVNYWYTAGFRRHYYYVPRNAPEPLQGNSKEAFCHDVVTYGTADNATIPRLENTPGVFNFWDTQDPRFFDNNGNTYLDINDVIWQKTKNFGGNIPRTSNFFAKFSGLQLVVTSPDNTTTTPSTTQPALGYYMAPWIDTNSSSYRSFCLTSTEYNSTNPLYQAFRDVLGVDTEGLYIAEKSSTTITNAEGQTVTTNPDYLLLRETDLKAAWFYVKNGVLTKPDEATVANVTTYFYYPLNKATPFIKSSSQELYRVKSAQELTSGDVSSSATSQTGSVGTFPPHDKKIGCIPKL
jgi:hypothetical protein